MSETVNIIKKKSLFSRINNFKHSLVFRISGIYLLLTLINLLLFWTANGANQMRLIRDKALLQTELTSLKIVKNLEPFINDIENQKSLNLLLQDSSINKNNNLVNSKFNKLFTSLRNCLKYYSKGKKIFLSEYYLFSSQGKLLYEYTVSKIKPKEIENKLQYIIKSLQLKEIQNKNYYGVPSLTGATIEIYIPLSANGLSDVVFMGKTKLYSIKKELAALFTLALSMLILLLLVQSIFGYLLFKILILPIRRLALGAKEVSSGNLDVIVLGEEKQDELGLLIKSFNYMLSITNRQTHELRKANKELITKDSIIQAELEMGQRIQKSILPQKIISNLFYIDVYYRTCQKVSGDYYDIFYLADGTVAVLIADVSGHGIPAALLMMMSKVLFSKLLDSNLTTSEIFEKINLELINYLTTTDYLTAFLIFINPNLEASYSNAGHRSALYWNCKNDTFSFLNTDGCILGVFEKAPKGFKSKNIQLEKGDKLLIYTDGLIERENLQGEIFGEQGLVKKFKQYSKLKPEKIKEKLINDIHSFSKESVDKDDTTLIILEIK